MLPGHPRHEVEGGIVSFARVGLVEAEAEWCIEIGSDPSMHPIRMGNFTSPYTAERVCDFINALYSKSLTEAVRKATAEITQKWCDAVSGWEEAESQWTFVAEAKIKEEVEKAVDEALERAAVLASESKPEPIGDFPPEWDIAEFQTAMQIAEDIRAMKSNGAHAPTVNDGKKGG
jgi:hypothetical protein